MENLNTNATVETDTTGAFDVRASAAMAAALATEEDSDADDTSWNIQLGNLIPPHPDLSGIPHILLMQKKL